MFRIFLFVTLAIFFSFTGFSQRYQFSVKLLTTGTGTSLRGLSVVNNNVIWVSGSNGTIGKSTDGGKEWKWYRVQGFEKTDFRDIEAFDDITAIIMGVGEPGYILKTNDGGASWKVVYENKSKGIFLDAMEFWNHEAGIVLGDPMGGRFFIARTFDGGSTWKEVPRQFLPVADSGEACFAASGTNIRALDNDEAVFVSGGLVSHVYIRDTKIRLPLLQGKETTGANSIAVRDRYQLKGGYHLIVVGGDFRNDTLSEGNCVYSDNRGRTWKKPETPPHGYRSCVTFISPNLVLTCGLTGADISADGGHNWGLISDQSFNTCARAKDGQAVFLAGNKGTIGILVVNKIK